MKCLFTIFIITISFPNCLLFAETSNANVRGLKSSILVLSQDDLFNKSLPGRALLDFFEQRQKKLVSEATKIEQQFIAEEKKLTEQRLELKVVEFQILADEFDVRVEKMRQSRAEKDKELQQDYIVWKKNFFQIVLPIVRELMSQFDALIVLDTNNRGLIYDKKVNVTNFIIERLNEDFLKNPLILEQVILRK